MFASRPLGTVNMHSTKFLVRASFCVVVVTGLAGCSAGAGPETSQSTAIGQLQSSHSMSADGSMVKQYTNATQLAGDATLLVLGEVTEQAPVTISGLLFTRYTFNVDSTLAGEAEATLTVLQVGEPGWQVGLDVPAYFEVGHRYLVFLQPTGLPANKPGGDGYYVIGTGAWVESGDSHFTIWLDHDQEVDLGHIPAAFALSEAAEVLSAGSVGSTR